MNTLKFILILSISIYSSTAYIFANFKSVVGDTIRNYELTQEFGKYIKRANDSNKIEFIITPDIQIHELIKLIRFDTYGLYCEKYECYLLTDNHKLHLDSNSIILNHVNLDENGNTVKFKRKTAK